MTDPTKAAAALSPYRVLDLTEGGCMIGARMLADLGADVIKIEPPGGSPSRIAPYFKDIVDPQKSLYWFAYNLNKRSVGLDINTPEGQEKFKALAADADIVMESFPPGYMDRLGLGYADLNKIKADIIFTSITPFGQSGPKSRYQSSDLTASASGGNLYIAGDPDRPPTWIGFPQALLFGGAEAAVGALTALWHRQTTGEGQHVDVSLQECAMSPTQNAFPVWAVNGMNFQRCGNALLTPATGIKLPTYYPCKDGAVFFFLQGGNEPFVSSTKRLVEWMHADGMSADWLDSMDFAADFNAATLNQDLVDRVAAMVSRFTSTRPDDTHTILECLSLKLMLYRTRIQGSRVVYETCPRVNRANFKTSHFVQSPRRAQILILEIFNIFLRLKLSPSLTLNKLKRFETGSMY